MIGHHNNWIRRGRWFKFYSVSAACLAGAFSVLSHFKPDDYIDHPIFNAVLSIANESSRWVVPICAGIIILVGLAEKIYGPPHIWAIVHYLLNEMHKRIFPNGGSLAENRVTLFKAKSGKFPWSGNTISLVPIERSHHLTRRSKACFKVKDDGTAEGVAGQVYLSRKCIYVDNLPNMSGESDLRDVSFIKMAFARIFFKQWCLSERQIKAAKLYADKTWGNHKRVIAQKVAKKVMPRALCGLPVDVGGTIWGVIVIDSSDEKLIGRDEILKFYEHNAAVISKILEQIK